MDAYQIAINKFVVIFIAMDYVTSVSFERERKHRIPFKTKVNFNEIVINFVNSFNIYNRYKAVLFEMLDYHNEIQREIIIEII